MIRTLRRSSQKTVRVLINTAAVVALLLAAAFLVPGLLGFERYVITGASMSGTFERGSLAIAKSVPVEDLVVGDVITYLPPPDSGLSELVTHRIVEIDDSLGAPVFRTQGDANAASDPWLFQLDDPLQARLEVAVPEIGWVFIALADREMRMVMIGIPAAVIGMLCLLDLVRAWRTPEQAPNSVGTSSALAA
ncbi:signal peptidase I [Nesterenkonia haasae]|uniref:signal peptidase I n=1 Tax=Nesterenkonia haasae TaxID=2587813 RepID=UPI0013913F63|nr:signal peptidase I [Nesterenkonia haasae]NDK30882.1 signal peptidase I [Nesterenkonia haasae]